MEKDHEHTTSTDISNCFNHYFSTICNKLAVIFQSQDKDMSDICLDIRAKFEFQEIRGFCV